MHRASRSSCAGGSGAPVAQSGLISLMACFRVLPPRPRYAKGSAADGGQWRRGAPAKVLFCDCRLYRRRHSAGLRNFRILRPAMSVIHVIGPFQACRCGICRGGQPRAMVKGVVGKLCLLRNLQQLDSEHSAVRARSGFRADHAKAGPGSGLLVEKRERDQGKQNIFRRRTQRGSTRRDPLWHRGLSCVQRRILTP